MVGRVARLLAPIAIIAVAVAVYLIVHATVDKNHHTVSPSHSAHAPGRHHHRHEHHRHTATFYVVKPGDTLSAIAVATHVSLTRLEALNPSVSANALQTGQRLRLRR
jgi:LysM repeat protein